MPFRTLLVEDHRDFREYMGAMLRDRFPQMQVTEAGTCRAAMEVVDHEVQDLIFMDMKLPDGVGTDLTRTIKGKHGNSVVVMLTANDLPEYLEASKDSGAAYFVTKGKTSFLEILGLVETVIAGRYSINTLV